MPKSASPNDLRFMKRALELAQKGRGQVHPNPMVGAVVVKNGRVVGEGWHQRYGEFHAEVRAIAAAKSEAKGATLYVNLEPCSHHGKTPPCADLLVKQGIQKCVIGSLDPNPIVSGSGIAILKRAGIEVELGVLAEECRELNADFFYWIRTKMPYVIVKAAQSVDGKIASSTGQSKWITGAKARQFSHRLRAESDAVLVGVNTVIQDNPLLTVRAQKVKTQPAKIILDSRLRTPERARIFSKQSPGRVILAVSKKAPLKKIKAFEKKAQVLVLPEKNGHVDFMLLMKKLGEMGLVKIMVEGGGETIASAFESSLVKEAFFFVAPTVIGGARAVSSVAGKGALDLRSAAHFRKWDVKHIGQDLLIHGIL